MSVYRMHPLMPDDYAFHSVGHRPAAREAARSTRSPGSRTPAIAERLTMPDLFYSFGTCHPGAITLHNYPRHLQNLTRDDGERLDLATVDILRDRERGVPRYNQFRRLLHKPPVEVVRRADRQPGVAQADQGGLQRRPREGRPDDRAVRRAAARRLRLQRDGVPHLHPDGVAAPEERPVLHRRLPAARSTRSSASITSARTRCCTCSGGTIPQLAPALEGVQNAFAPWKKLQGPVGHSRYDGDSRRACASTEKS